MVWNTKSLKQLQRCNPILLAHFFDDPLFGGHDVILGIQVPSQKVRLDPPNLHNSASNHRT